MPPRVFQIGLVLATLWLAMVAFFALFAPVMGFLADPGRPSLNANQGPSWSALFGTRDPKHTPVSYYTSPSPRD